MSGRCKACNAIMKENEIRWRPEIGEHGEHEELCLRCRQSVYQITEEDLSTMDDLEEEGL